MMQMKGIFLLVLLGVASSESMLEQQEKQHDLNQAEMVYLQDEDVEDENPDRKSVV